jgi:hypothetical protein
MPSDPKKAARVIVHSAKKFLLQNSTKVLVTKAYEAFNHHKLSDMRYAFPEMVVALCAATES